jgi:hypothetical protein
MLLQNPTVRCCKMRLEERFFKRASTKEESYAYHGVSDAQKARADARDERTGDDA